MKHSLTSRQAGFIFIILSGMCFGALGLFGKLAYRQSIAPGELLALRYSISAIITGLLITISSPRSFFMGKFEIISSLLLGVFGYALFSSLFFMSLSKLSASLSVLLLYTYPAMVVILSQFILRERLGRIGLIALAISTLGMFGLVWGEWTLVRPIYLLYGIGSAFFYALYIMYSRKYLKDTPAMPSSFFVQLGAGSILSLIHFQNFERPIFILNHHALLIVSMAIICSVMAMTLFLAGLRRLTSSEASILSTTEPLFGVIIATVFLDETLSALQLAGGVFIIISMILIAKKNN